MVIDLPAIAYTAAVVGGGVLGYIKSKSIPSLGAGLLFGSFLSYGTYQISVNPHNYGVMLGTSTTLGAMMAYRYYNSGKIMPAGIITVMSAAMIMRILYRHFTLPEKALSMKS